MITAKIVCDSTNSLGKRITTFVCTYNRFIHSELMTHRAFSRNAASSRAIPVSKMIKAIEDNPALPIWWGKNEPGMQANAELSPELKKQALEIWLESAKFEVAQTRRLVDIGLHKQVANRILEPYAHITTIITATEWGNFFNLRVHKDAQPEFQELAKQMLICYKNSIPKFLKAGEWHLPFTDKFISGDLTTEQLMKITTARCARVSYLTFEGDINPEKDYELHDGLMNNGHMSPFEHVAQSTDTNERYGNFIGWKQYRKTLPNENREYLDPDALLKGFEK